MKIINELLLQFEFKNNVDIVMLLKLILFLIIKNNINLVNVILFLIL